MMRLLIALLVLGLGGLVAVSMVDPASVFAPAGSAWFPAEMGRGAERVDALFDLINVVAVALLALTFVGLAWVVWRGAGRSAGEGSERKGSHGLELLWTAIPAAIVVYLTWTQIGVRDAIAADAAGDGDPLIIEVEGVQFEWLFTYAGADGAFGSLDDVTSVVDMPVPVGRPVELRMESADVIHSFYVPQLRIKRDVVPGAVVPLAFTIDADDHAQAGSPRTLELRCAELCGWGHYAMVGRLLPMEPEAFEAWVREQADAAHAAVPALRDESEYEEYDESEEYDEEEDR